MRGYDRAAVDQWRDEVADLVERLEAQQPRDSAVRFALDEVGRETAAILQSAHDSADEIEARSRSQAGDRLRLAEREAEATIRAAEEHAERLGVDTRALWDERARLIEEIRRLADEVLGVADDALDRLHPPTALPGGEPDGAGMRQVGAGAIDLAPAEATGVADPSAPAEDPTLEDPSEDPTLEDEPTLAEEPELEPPAEDPELGPPAERATLVDPPGDPEPNRADEERTVEVPVVDPEDPRQAR